MAEPKRKAKVRREAWWDGSEWRFIPNDTTMMRAFFVDKDESGQELPPQNIYAAKGWKPVSDAPESAKKLLPSNLDDVLRFHNVAPEFAKAASSGVKD